MFRSRACGRLVLVAIAATAASGAIGCVEDIGPPPPEEVASLSEGVIIGTNDLLPVTQNGSNVPAKYRSSLDGFGRLHIGGGLCTATHVGGGVAISAGHCFNAPASRVDDRACSASVEWGYRSSGAVSTSTCTRILAMQQGGGLDYAIFSVSPVPPVSLGVALDSPPNTGLPLTIFSHANGDPLKWSRTCSVSSTNSTELSYQCDTLPGSSGASVLRDDTLAVVGIHWGGGGSANSATKLTSTPLAEFIGGGPPPPPPGGTTTETHSGSVARSAWVHFPISVRPSSHIDVTMTGSGDPDLYVRVGAQPTTTSYNCRPYTNGASETCSVDVPSGQSTVYVSVRGYTAATYTVTATFVAP